MKEYDIYLPRIPDQKRNETVTRQVKERLKEEFGGYTHFAQTSEGVWKYGGVTFRDEVTVIRVLSEEVAKERMATLKQFLQEQLEQTEILVVQREVQLVE